MHGVNGAGQEAESYRAACALIGADPNASLRGISAPYGSEKHGNICACGEFTYGEEWAMCGRCLNVRGRELQIQGVH